MSPIDGGRGGPALQDRGIEARWGGLRLPGLDVAAQWRAIFAVAGGADVDAPQIVARGADSSSGAGRRANATAEGPGGAGPHEARHATPEPPNGNVAAPAPQQPAAGSRATRLSTAAPLGALDASSTGVASAAGAERPSPPMAGLRSAAPVEARAANPAQARLAADANATPRAGADEPASHRGIGRCAGRLPDGEPAAATRHARESVQVHCHAGGVVVIVRDANLAPDRAIRCSLETAHALRGARAALQRVRLNGRTVFERADAPSAGSGPPGRLCFAC